jgi:hypothetical protein
LTSGHFNLPVNEQERNQIVQLLELGELGLVTRFRSRPKKRVDFHAGAEIFLSSIAARTAVIVTQIPFRMVPGTVAWGQNGRGMNLTAHLQLVPR